MIYDTNKEKDKRKNQLKKLAVLTCVLFAAALTNSAYSESIDFLKGVAAGVKVKDGIRTITSSLSPFQIAAERVKAFEHAGAEHAVE
jgi:hypothetical protein